MYVYADNISRVSYCQIILWLQLFNICYTVFVKEGAPQLQIKKYSEVLQEIEVALSPEEQKNFIENRIKEIESTSENRNFGVMYDQKLTGFIKPEAKIQRSPMVEPLQLDDPAVYEVMFETIKEFKDHQGWKDKPLRSMMPEIIQHSLSKYFGNQIGWADTESKNRQFYFEHSDSPESKPISLSEIRGKGLAVCAEKAALAQNLVTFAGLESHLVMSNCKLYGEKPELHAFNILKTENGYFIYDPTNPSITLNKNDNSLKNSSAAIYKISDEDFEKIERGEEIDVVHTDYVSDSEGNSVGKNQTRTYKGSEK